jgi:hypothetical protein
MFERVRRFLNNNPLIAAGALVVVIVLAVILISMRGFGSNYKNQSLYYSVDDGKTFFKAAAQAAPFKQGGQDVFEAVVFTCPDNGNQEFVGFLRRYAPQYQKAANDSWQLSSGGRLPPSEVKKPGAGDWVKPAAGPPMGAAPGAQQGTKDAQLYQDITQVRCPDGRLAIMHIAN